MKKINRSNRWLIVVLIYFLFLNKDGFANETNKVLPEELNYYIHNSRYPEALELIARLIDRNDLTPIERAEIRVIKSSLLLRFGDYTEAHEEALFSFQVSADSLLYDSLAGEAAKLLVEINGNLGEMHSARKFVDYCRKHFSSTRSKKLYADGLQVEGNFLRSIGDLESAKILLDSCIRISLKEDYDLVLAKALNNRGIIYAVESEFNEAYNCFQKSWKILRSTKYPDETLCEIINNLTFYHILQNNLDSAMFMSKLQIKSSTELNYPLSLYKAYFHLSEIYKRKNYFDSAYFYQSTYFALRDSIFNHQVNQKVNWTKYQSEIKLVQIENSLYRAELKNSRLTTAVLLGLALLLIISSLILFRVNFLRTKENKILFDRIQSLLNQSKIKDDRYTEKHETELKESVVETVLIDLKKWEAKKGFLVKDCTLELVAKACKTNSKYLSKIILVTYDERFPEYINKKRIVYILEQLQSNLDLRKYTIEALSDMAGYRSKTSFGNAFKSYTGLTPSVYLMQLSKHQPQDA